METKKRNSSTFSIKRHKDSKNVESKPSVPIYNIVDWKNNNRILSDEEMIAYQQRQLEELNELMKNEEHRRYEEFMEKKKMDTKFEKKLSSRRYSDGSDGNAAFGV
ncbi:hypothetical protein SNEBB_000924 [Seison nebaliae]|nr:hypothetical protein SNEBB_000924 [Seison nebaliae]